MQHGLPIYTSQVRTKAACDVTVHRGAALNSSLSVGSLLLVFWSLGVAMALDARPLVDGLAVSPQVTEADIRDAHAAGYRTIINNRPDGEEPGQLSSAQAARLAGELGLTYIYQPATGPTLEQVADDFGRALVTAPGPVLAHCRSGTRCAILWAFAEAKAGVRDSDEILRAVAAAGYDLSAHAPTIAHYTQSRAV